MTLQKLMDTRNMKLLVHAIKQNRRQWTSQCPHPHTHTHTHTAINNNALLFPISNISLWIIAWDCWFGPCDSQWGSTGELGSVLPLSHSSTQHYSFNVFRKWHQLFWLHTGFLLKWECLCNSLTNWHYNYSPVWMSRVVSTLHPQVLFHIQSCMYNYK